MSGIVGIISLTGSATPPLGLIRRMSDAQSHRGSHEVVIERPGVAFANRSHLSLSTSDMLSGQPNGQIISICDGTLFNRPTLARELHINGEVPAPYSQLLGALWQKYGAALCDRLRGQFAFAIWDERERRLLLARDHFGVSPLHWSRQGDWLLFASEIKALLASGLVSASVDMRGIHHVWTFFGTPGPVTCFDGVSSLLPGRYMDICVCTMFEAGALRTIPYWQMDFPDCGHEEGEQDEAELVDQYESILQRAIKERLEGVSSVAAYSSGGLDSSLLVTMAAKLRGQPLESYTFDVEHAGHDESALAADVANYVGSRPTVVKLSGLDLLNGFPQLVKAAESPVIDVSASALMQLAERVHSDGHCAVITGEGADELQGGYPWFRIQQRLDWLDRAALGMPISALGFRAYVWLVHSRELPSSFINRSLRYLGGKNAWLLPYMLMAAAKQQFFSRDLLANLRGHLPFEDLDLNSERMRRWDPLNRSIYLGTRIHLVGLHLAARGDRAAGRSGVVTRYPFLDRELFDFLAPLAPRWKLRGLTDKYLERQLAKRWVPQQVLSGHKKLLHAPLDALQAARPAKLMDQLMSAESLKKTGYFDSAAVQHWREAAPKMRHGFRRLFLEMGLVGVLSTQLWHQQFFDPTLADIDVA
jgi:asparagine synthase (glutamine-hydrolysing)